MGTNVPAGCNVCNITGGTRPGNGSNLFHSFGQFDVGTTGVANFLNDSALPTNNILSRVTGGNPSNIFGTIQTEGFGNANLFLMNPAGIVFGPNASLNVGGSSHFTTADYLRLADGVQFTALPGAQDALLSIAPVAAFGFLGPNPGTISVDGSTLSVGEGQTLSLVGGDITIGSGLNAPGGKIAIASVASPGEVLADTFASAPNINGQSFTTMGNISLSEGTLLDVSADAAGTVIIRGGRLEMRNARVSSDTGESKGAATAVDIQLTDDLIIETDSGPAITAHSFGSGDAGEVSILSKNMNVVGTTEDILTVIDTVSWGTGHAGDVSITTGDLQMTADSVEGLVLFVDTGVGSEGPGGNIVINANTLNMNGGLLLTGDNFLSENPSGPAGNVTVIADQVDFQGTQIWTTSFLNNKAGNITINGGDITFRDFGGLNATGVTQSGDININANHLLVSSSASLESNSLSDAMESAPPGGISLMANVIELKEGGFLNTLTIGNSDAGPIQLVATESISLSGSEPLTDRPSGIFSSSLGFSGPHGNAGNVFISTPKLEINDGARIITATGSQGVGGDITINAESMTIKGQQFEESNEFIFGLGHPLASSISTSTLGDPASCGGICGNAGKITINTGSFMLENGAQIDSGTSSTGQGNTITLNASENISISGTLNDGTPGGIFSRTIGSDPGSGKGGDVSLIAGQSFLLKEGAKVSASSSGPGHAGDIAITAGAVTIAQGGVVDSGTTGTGTGGVISVNTAGNMSISGTGAGVFSRTTGSDPGSGDGGSIALTSGQNFTLSDGATVSASSSGPGNAGDIQLTAQDTILLDKATVTTEAALASGGNTKLKANDTIQLVDSTIASSVKGDENTQGGNISLDPDFIILQNSQILAQADKGKGGNISLVANDVVLVDPFSVVDASAATGISGSVDIQAPTKFLSGTIAPLPQNPAPVTNLYGSRCVAGAGGHFSTFVDSKADSLAPTPGTFLASPFLPLSGSAQVASVGHAGPPSGLSETRPAVPLQVASYSPPVLFGQGDEMLSACP